MMCLTTCSKGGGTHYVKPIPPSVNLLISFVFTLLLFLKESFVFI
jgi:hypothetical protein